jgi:hypothetical protein
MLLLSWPRHGQCSGLCLSLLIVQYNRERQLRDAKAQAPASVFGPVLLLP